ncbi:ribonuclease H-like domain-containing protein [Tanacetum coccineum]|uniref:Ribonuclease H-like domain-containing protein n=1 Tax=Tanacetum coccineum TaxID=301880 RepID=A0ABQ4YDL4_9ASTR
MLSLTRAGAVEAKPDGLINQIPINSRNTMGLDRVAYHHSKDGSTNYEDWLDRKRNSLMVAASLIATMAFQAGVNPPSGVWLDTLSWYCRKWIIYTCHPLWTSTNPPYRPLHLKNVLVTPNIIKNLVSVRKFTTDSKCSIDFNPYGFTIRDYHTRQTLLRCDSTGDLYPLHVASSAFALLTNNHSLWHQRLGHPGDNVIQTLSSRGLVSYNKQNTQHLCRACQLGKQTKLPFQRSTSIVTSPFDIIHSELWTSPVSSMSGYKYYVLFLDHYSYFLWVYPLHRKSDAQSKLMS